mgnify:CR=1 FL=1
MTSQSPARGPRSVTLVDTTLRDGMSSVSHRFTTRDVAAIAAGLDRAGIISTVFNALGQRQAGVGFAG